MTHLFKKGYFKVKQPPDLTGTLEAFKNGKFCRVKETDRPTNFGILLSVLNCNGGRDCFAKFKGDVYMITMEGTWRKVCRCLPDMTFKEYLDKSKTE